MLKLGTTTYRIQHSRDHERILLTVWRNGRLAEHKIHHLRRTKDGAISSSMPGRCFISANLSTPTAATTSPADMHKNVYIHAKMKPLQKPQ